MEKIFFARGKGRVYKMLTVHSDGKQYRLHYQILDRTNPSKAQRAAGEKERRFPVLDQEFFVNCGESITPESYPLPELTLEFVVFLQKGESVV